jgi:hypothetical protein
MEQKDAYWETQRKRLQEISAQIERLQSARDKEGEGSLNSEELEALRVKLEATLKKLDALKEAGEGAWQDLKSGLEMAADDLKRGVEQAVAEFGRKQK